MAVWLDRNGGALPSWLTGMVGKDNDGHAGHGRTMFGDRQPIQRSYERCATTDADAAAQNCCSLDATRAEL